MRGLRSSPRPAEVLFEGCMRRLSHTWRIALDLRRPPTPSLSTRRRQPVRRLLASLWIILAASVATAQAAGTVTAIKVSGNRTLDAEAIRAHMELAEGRPYDAGKADRSLKALFATGLFADVRIERHEDTVLVTVVENPVVS